MENQSVTFLIDIDNNEEFIDLEDTIIDCKQMQTTFDWNL